MGKFAGFLKRAKRLAGIGSGIMGTINNLYKSVKPAVDTVVSFLPGGGVINQVLDKGSKVIDKVQDYTKDWVTDTDRKTLNSMNRTADKIGGFLNSGPLEFAANKILDYKDSGFGNPSNEW